MGGNAFSDKIKLSRLTPKQFDDIKKYVLDFLTPFCLDVKVPMHILDKRDHGDLDVLYLLDENKISKKDFDKLCAEKFNSEEVNYLSPPAVSYHFNVGSNYMPAQIDLIPADNLKHLSYQHFYMSHGDFGSILGQICGQLGYTLSINNLRIKVNYLNDPSKMTGQIVLSDEPEKICDFLGYDFEVLKKPFENEIDFFEFMMSSKYFEARFFNVEESFNYTHRKRAEKRPLYTRFMKYVNQKEKDNQMVDSLKPKPNKPENQANAAKHFNKFTEYQNQLQKFERIQILKSKFNGDIVKKYLPIFDEKISINNKNGKFLGQFCHKFRSKFSDDEIVDDLSEDRIREEIVGLYGTCCEDMKWLDAPYRA